MRHQSTVMLSLGLCCAFSLSVPQADCSQPTADGQVLDAQLRHVRNAGQKEWAEFPDDAELREYSLSFQAEMQPAEFALQLTQHNVKQTWSVEINGRTLGKLHADENPIIAFFAVPAGTVVEGDNELKIRTTSTTPDDIRVGEVVLHANSLQQVLNRCHVDVVVREDGREVPSRVTILEIDRAQQQSAVRADAAGQVLSQPIAPANPSSSAPQVDVTSERLMTTGAGSNNDMAVRPGVIYCRGTASFGLPAGTYTIIAGRGPEYSIAETQVELSEGESRQIELDLRREVPTPGLVSCDTHVHTFTHSGHGDATIEERMLTLAGEAIEMPIATDHNLHIDYGPTAKRMQLDSWFTPVIGNEVTTAIGHFNVFPIESVDIPVADHKATSWDDIFRGIRATPGVQAIILNHGRDLHSRYRPFDPRHHLASLGHNTAGWQLQANAMEIINSGAQQSDMQRLVEDWMGLLNAGYFLTPVGSSDSHDVARHFVGQARTYIVADDSDVGKIDTHQAVRNFLDGQVTVSCGLICRLKMNREFGSGSIVPRSREYIASVEVLGPSWIEADELEILMNGRSVFRTEIPQADRAIGGVKYTATVPLPWNFSNDAFVVAVARGPGVRRLHWPIARPYQPTSIEWAPQCLGVTGAVWLDINGNGQRDSARSFAQQIFDQNANEPEVLLKKLSQFDSAVALHALAMMFNYNEPDMTTEVRQQLPEHVQEALSRYALEWRNSQIEAAR